jgi:hypothetical protein
MASTEEKIQKTVISLDGGRLAVLVWRAIFILVALGLAAFYLFHEFRGLPVSQAMDQAQIGREILRGNGWSTKVIRPLAVGELMRNGKDLKTAIRQDTYNAPIPPLLDAAAIAIPVKAHWDLQKGDAVFAGDRAIACMGAVFLLASLVVLYWIARELFDARLAAQATGLALVSDMLWRYSLSGLPQMFLLLMLHLNVYALLRAMRAHYQNEPFLGWIAAVGFGFGIMALTHALSIFIFVPVLVFSLFFFRPHGWTALLMMAAFLVVYTPWLVRNQMVCGDFRGIAAVSALDGIVLPEAGHMRRLAIDLSSASGNYFAANFRQNLIGQINRLIEYFGWSFIAPLALVSVLHAFRRPITSTFRWVLFAMWGSAVCGMSIFGMKEERGFAANQFYLLFVPLFICYGLAYVLVQWDRRIGLGFILPRWRHRAPGHTLMRRLMLVVIFFVSGLPVIGRLMNLDKSTWPVEWPPYLPPAVVQLKTLFHPDEIIASDMPWAVAWYADRYSLWLPYQANDLVDLSDYRRLGMPVAGLFFTPISGSQNTLGDLLGGEYCNWTAYIVRTVDPTKTPYPYRMIIGMPDCVLYMDRNRLKTTGN